MYVKREDEKMMEEMQREIDTQKESNKRMKSQVMQLERLDGGV